MNSIKDLFVSYKRNKNEKQMKRLKKKCINRHREVWNNIAEQLEGAKKNPSKFLDDLKVASISGKMLEEWLFC